jgi:NAD(P)-dependent dehydrogenase (short-subunit alcohol dehydrogenase family)
MTNNSSKAETDKRVVLITGASSGIGKACAAHLAARGYRVFGTRRTVLEPEAESSIEMLSMNLDDEPSVNAAIKTLLANSGRIDAVINNAGFALMGAVEDTSIEEAKAQMETNFFGVLRVCRAVLPTMRQQRSGHILNISSLAGVIGLPFNGLYSASKFALEGMTESLRLETRKYGIHVVLIEPGDFRTGLPAARRTSSGSQTNDAYSSAFARFKVAQDKDESNAPSPEPIAYLVEKILSSRSPRLRYTVGMAGQRIVSPLKRLLPQRLFEWALRQALNL